MKHKPMMLITAVALCGLLMFGATALADVVAEGTITLESVKTDGTQGNEASEYPSISADGRYIAFQSYATTLVDGDVNGYMDIFLRDTTEGTTTLVSVAASYGGTYGYGADYFSQYPAISGDGRYVAFQSYASNLYGGFSTDYTGQVFMRDTVAGTTDLVSMAYGGGTYGNGTSNYPSVSFDGQYVAFQSYATNLTDDEASGYSDIFIRDTVTGTTSVVSMAAYPGAYGGYGANGNSYTPSISGDGSAVAFYSQATNLLAENNPTSTYYDIFVYDTASDTIELISRNYGGGAGAYGYGANNYCYNPAINYGGRYVAFYSQATNLIDGGSNGTQQVFVYDRTTGDMVVASAADGGTAQGYGGRSQDPAISPDGRYVAFYSQADNLTEADQDAFEYPGGIYLRDLVDQNTTLMSRIDNTLAGYGDGGVYGGGGQNPSVSAYGMYVAFDFGPESSSRDKDVLSLSPNSVEDDNDYKDVFRVVNDTDGDGVPDSTPVVDDDDDDDDDDTPAPAPRLPDTDTSTCFITTLMF